MTKSNCCIYCNGNVSNYWNWNNIQFIIWILSFLLHLYNNKGVANGYCDDKYNSVNCVNEIAWMERIKACDIFAVFNPFILYVLVTFIRAFGIKSWENIKTMHGFTKRFKIKNYQYFIINV